MMSQRSNVGTALVARLIRFAARLDVHIGEMRQLA